MHARRLILVAVLALAACQQSKPGRIGIITALSGTQQAFGQAHDRGFDIALEEINASGGVLGKPLEVVKYDDQSKADIAAQGVAKLVDQDKVSALIGSYSSESTKAIVPLVARRGMPLLMPTATADNVMDNTEGWSFRLCAGAIGYAEAMVGFFKDVGLPKSLAIVYENTNFGQANGASMKKAATAAGIPIATEESYTAKSPSYTAMLQKVKEKNPDAIYFASYLLDATSLMHQARQVDLNPRFFTAAGTGFSAPEFPTEEKGAGKDSEYTFSVTQWMPESKWPGSAQFTEKFKAKYGSTPAYHAVQAYTALKVMVDAVKRAGKWDPTAIRDALKATNMPETTFGPVKFDERGQNLHPVLVTQIQKGKYILVYPKSVAVGDPVIPTPKWSGR
jgi:ABC-type branched-chain amino acid transport systems, periplasmic component